MTDPEPAAVAQWRQKLAAVVDGQRMQRIISTLIVINAVTLGLETSKTAMAVAGNWLVAADHLILTVFVVEIAARMVLRGLGFFRDPWNVFDFVVVGIALLPATGQLSVLRALRILRVLRLISIVPQLKRVVASLLSAIPGLSSIIAIMVLVFYVFGVIATKLYGDAFPQWFGTLGESMYSLFQIMTLESWSMGIVRPVMEIFPHAWLFFVPFILVTTFTVLNLFIAIIVSAMETQRRLEEGSTEDVVAHAANEITAAMHADVQAMREELRELKNILSDAKTERES
jgi:voltage-gated sodium channel